MGIRTYSTTPASNQLAVPNGWPEGMAPSSVNDCARQNMADLRAWYEDAEWTDLGHTPTRTGTTTFTIPTDVTSFYTMGRRVKLTDSSTLYGTISSSSYSSPNTTVTVDLDSGALSASLTNVYVAILKPSNNSVHVNFGRKGISIASASTTDLSAATGDFIDITGTTTITAFGTLPAGVERVLRFNGALTLTYNATSLILPSAANITTASGDTAIFRSLGSGNWLCIDYVKANGTSIINGLKGSDIASASTTDLSTATGDFVFITGTTTITAFGTLPAGIERTVKFAATLTLTYNATSLILPGAANITTAAGDTAIFRSLGSGNWLCISYSPASGKSVVGSSGCTLIASATASSSATIDFTSISNSTYSSYLIVGDRIAAATSSVELYFRVSVAGTFQATASNYIYEVFRWTASATGVAGLASGGGATAISINSGENLGNSTDQVLNFILHFGNCAQTSQKKYCTWNSQYNSVSPTQLGNVGSGGFVGSNSAVDGFRFLMSSGNIGSGVFYLYGLT